MKMLLMLTVVAAGAAAQSPLDADAIRDRLDKYLIQYEPQLSALVADERMTQRDGPSRNAYPSDPAKDREILSEVAFISLPGDVGWLGFRRVTTVNKKKIAESGPSLALVLSDGAKDDYDQARLLLAQSAEHNLGFPRTTNLPNLPLEFLHPRNRHRLTHRVDAFETIRGVQTARMVFEERSTPTIIRRADGGDMKTLVSAWVEPETGRLLRAQVKSRDVRIGVLPFDNVIWVDFRPDEKLGLLVPYEMKEEFFAGRFREGMGTARYTNYRQFKTGARIVPPKAR
ncbi:MAG TPA: hypothetical protein VEA16_09620 [Vicinamibacterales bacterium]|nr:hypothetical protein [Vicinamibacterales bacterium]